MASTDKAECLTLYAHVTKRKRLLHVELPVILVTLKDEDAFFRNICR